MTPNLLVFTADRIAICGVLVRTGSEVHSRAVAPDKDDVPQVGLCLSCAFAQRIESARGSVFYLCQRSRTDPAFPKYPHLPVLQCAGYRDLNVPSGECGICE
jgi:hypothetical protein